jgi:hypothetical protein
MLQNHSNYYFNFEALRGYAHSKWYSCWSIFIINAGECNINFNPSHIECALSNTWHLLDVSRARKNVPNCESTNKIHLSFELANGNKGFMLIYCMLMYVGQIWISIEHPLSNFKIKMKIPMILEPQHKNFKGQYKIKERVKKNSKSGDTYLYTNGFVILLTYRQI